MIFIGYAKKYKNYIEKPQSSYFKRLNKPIITLQSVPWKHRGTEERQYNQNQLSKRPYQKWDPWSLNEQREKRSSSRKMHI